MSLRVLSPGLCSIVVDWGRPRSRGLGVPVGGPADRAAWQLANALVGNPPDAGALEIALAGPALRAGCELAVVVFGAPFRLESDRQSLAAGKTFTLSPGEILRVGGTPVGARAYLAVRGGLLTTPVLDSRSELEPVTAGRELPCAAGSVRGLALPFISAPFSGVDESDPVTLRCLDGAQADWFPPGRFEGAHYAVTAASNRMGLRLEGPALDRPTREMVSEPVCPGTVQVTNEGRCIVLGIDGQTIGGYPKVAQVVRADLDKLGQLRPGRRVRFVRVTLAEAESAAREQARELGRWLARLAAAERPGA